jgi:hypothetical protein
MGHLDELEKKPPLFKFGDIISISDLSEDGRVQVGVKKCKDP